MFSREWLDRGSMHTTGCGRSQLPSAGRQPATEKEVIPPGAPHPMKKTEQALVNLLASNLCGSARRSAWKAGVAGWCAACAGVGARGFAAASMAAPLWMLQCRKLATVGIHGSLRTHHHLLHDR